MTKPTFDELRIQPSVHRGLGAQLVPLPRCIKLRDRPETRLGPAGARKVDSDARLWAMKHAWHDGAFWCHFTGTELVTDSQGHPRFATWEHLTPRDEGSVVLAGALVNAMKGNMNEPQFTDMVLALAKKFSGGEFPVDAFPRHDEVSVVGAIDPAPSHTVTGREFQELVRSALLEELGEALDSEVGLPIGTPPKPHRFDLASRSRKLVVECKAYEWTAGGNVPSAKISHLRQAVGYLIQLPGEVTRVLAVKRATHAGKAETLGAYFVRLNANILGPILVIEFDFAGRMTVLQGSVDDLHSA